MTRPVFWSRDALDDLKSAVSYIARDNPEAGRRVAAAICETGLKLGVHSTGRKGRVAGTFEKSVAGLPYIVAYAVETRTGATASSFSTSSTPRAIGPRSAGRNLEAMRCAGVDAAAGGAALRLPCRQPKSLPLPAITPETAGAFPGASEWAA